MIQLHPYTKSDSEKIVCWLPDEKAFRLWCAERFKSYPLSSEEFDSVYSNSSPDLFGLVAKDNGETVGHLFVQNLGKSKYKFGLIIVDSSKRGKGYGKTMLIKALEYAKNSLNAKIITLSVFDDNISAYKCYKSLGFTENGKYVEYEFLGEKHKYFELEYYN